MPAGQFVFEKISALTGGVPNTNAGIDKFYSKYKSRVERKTSVSQMVVFPQTLSPHHEGVMKITTFLSVNNENLGAIACMSNGT